MLVLKEMIGYDTVLLIFTPPQWRSGMLYVQLDLRNDSYANLDTSNIFLRHIQLVLGGYQHSNTADIGL